MDISEHFLRLFSYDQWANQQILLTLQDNINDIDKSGKVVKSFAHIAGAQELWYNRIESKPVKSLNVWPEYDLPVAFQELMTLNKKWQQLIKVNNDKLDRIISYTNSKGTAFETPLSDILHHIIIHGQHHRAQIAKLLRNAKVAPPATDFIYFSRAN